jgi:CHAT domain-containing protein
VDLHKKLASEGAPHVLRHEQATRATVLDALPQTQVVHLSCHGATDWAEPLHSGVVMAGDEMLTVGDLLDRRLPAARLATLSACETGIVGTKLPDEVVALPSALAQAGFAGVAASLWSVADASTAMLMERFYRLWREERLEPPEALRRAQIWLRDTTNREKADTFRRDVPALSAGKMPEMIAADFFSQAAARRPADRDFAHPFWWAAFYLTGV